MHIRCVCDIPSILPTVPNPPFGEHVQWCQKPQQRYHHYGKAQGFDTKSHHTEENASLHSVDDLACLSMRWQSS